MCDGGSGGGNEWAMVRPWRCVGHAEKAKKMKGHSMQSARFMLLCGLFEIRDVGNHYNFPTLQ